MVDKTKKHKKDLFYTYDMLKESIERIYRLLESSDEVFYYIYAIPRGGLIPGVLLSHKTGLPLVNNIHNKGTLIIDDICDTGNTFNKYNNITRVSLVAKPEGLNKIKDLIYDIKVEDNVWVHFPWEKY